MRGMEKKGRETESTLVKRNGKRKELREERERGKRSYEGERYGGREYY